MFKKIYKFCKPGFKATRKVIIVCSLAVIMISSYSCILQKESQSVQKFEDLEDKEKKETGVKIIVEIFHDVYGETNENESVETLEKTREIVKRLGEKGYAAIDSRNQINMTQAEQVIHFCKAVDEKEEAEQRIVEIMDSGWFAIYDFKTTDGNVDIEKNTYQCKSGILEKKVTSVYNAEDWKYSDDGFLMFSGSWYSEELYVLTLSEAEEHKAFRVLPLDEKYRELNRKYLLPISYERNNMFLVDWNESNFGELDFYDLYDILYPHISSESMSYRPDENLGIGTVYQIPKAEFEKVIMAYFNIDSETLQDKMIYNSEEVAYEYKPRGLEEVEYPEYPFPEVVGYTENSDGTITLNVNVVFPYLGISKVYVHEVVVRPFTDGTFQYVSNRVIPSEDNYEETWHVNRLTAEEWKKIYGENK